MPIFDNKCRKKEEIPDSQIPERHQKTPKKYHPATMHAWIILHCILHTSYSKVAMYILCLKVHNMKMDTNTALGQRFTEAKFKSITDSSRGLKSVCKFKICKNFAKILHRRKFLLRILQLFCNFFAIFLQFFCNFFAIFLQIFCKKCAKIFS